MAVLPIVTYDDPVLTTQARAVEPGMKELEGLINDMFETMYEAEGVGLAAPQIGRSLQLFVVDADAITEEEDGATYGPRVYINPYIEALGEETGEVEEGCLSLPDVREKVTRPLRIRIRYMDTDFREHEEICDGWFARVLQHEYDHLKGVLFIDYLGSFRRRLIKSKLEAVRLGKVQAEYELAPKRAEGATDPTNSDKE